MLDRLTKLSQVVGNTSRIQYIDTKLKEGGLPNFLILTGMSGVGKTTVGKIIAATLNCEGLSKPCGSCDWCTENLDRVINRNKDTDTIFHYKMTGDCTPEKMQEIIANMNPGFLKQNQYKVLLLDEAHRMTEAAQDTLLIDTEFLDKRIYVILITTDSSKFKDTIMDRATVITFQALSMNEMRTVIKRDLHERKLIMDNPDLAVELLANYSKGKPRKALQILNGLGTNQKIPLTSLKDFINHLDIDDIIPIINSLKESAFVGIETIMDLQITSETQSNLINLLIEAKRVQRGVKCQTLGFEEVKNLRAVLQGIDEELITRLLYKVSGVPTLTNISLLHSFLACHPEAHKIMEPPSLAHSDEGVFTATNKVQPQGVPRAVESKVAPTLEMLSKSATILG